MQFITTDRPDLNQPQVVAKIFLGLAKDGIACRLAFLNHLIGEHDFRTIEDKEIQTRVFIFLNRDPAYVTDTEWHRPGAIDAFLARMLHLDDRGAENILNAALNRFLTEVAERIQIAQNSDIRNWEQKIQDIVEKYVDLFRGVVPVPKPSLRDELAVENIFLGLAEQVVASRLAMTQGTMTEDGAKAWISTEIEERIAIFLGQDEHYVSDSNWNKAGAIDAFLAEELKLESGEPNQVIHAALSRFVISVWNRLNLVENPDLTVDQWKPALQPLLTGYQKLFRGIPAPELNAEEPKADTPFSSEPEPEPINENAIARPAKITPETSRNGKYKWALLCACVLCLISIVIIPAEIKIYRAKKKWLLLKNEITTYRLDRGTIVAKVFRDGREAEEKPIQIQDNVSTPGTTNTSTENSLANVPIEFWFDLNTNAGLTRFLVAAKMDPDFRAQPDAPFAWDLWLVDDHGNSRLLHKSVFQAKFSPEGGHIAYTSSDAVLHVQTIDGIELARAERVYEPAWNSDGSVILVRQVAAGKPAYPPSHLQLARFFWKADRMETVSHDEIDQATLHYHPSGDWVLMISNSPTEAPSFWKIFARAGDPIQFNNIHYSADKKMLRPHSTTLWSRDGSWFVFDSKVGSTEQVLGLEFDEKANCKRVLKLSDGLSPQWAGPWTLACQKRTENGVETIRQELPEKKMGLADAVTSLF